MKAAAARIALGALVLVGCSAETPQVVPTPLDRLRAALTDPAQRSDALLAREHLRIARTADDERLVRELAAAQWQALPAPTSFGDYDALQPQVRELARAAGLNNGLELFEWIEGDSVASLGAAATVFLAESEPLYLALEQLVPGHEETVDEQVQLLTARGRRFAKSPGGETPASQLFASASESEAYWRGEEQPATLAAAARLRTLRRQRANARWARFQIAWLGGRAVPAATLFREQNPRHDASPVAQALGDPIRGYAAWRRSLGLRHELERRFGETWWEDDRAMAWLRTAFGEPSLGDRQEERRWLTAVAQTLTKT